MSKYNRSRSRNETADKAVTKRKKRKVNKPPKPYADYPLTPHNSGAWMKKINGRICYFGRWGQSRDGKMERLPGDGWREALEIYKAQADDLYAGREPRKPDDDRLTVANLCNAFLTAKLVKFNVGRLTARTFSEYRHTTDRLIRVFGKSRSVDDLRPADFVKLSADITKTWGLVRLGNEIGRIISVFKFGRDNGLILRPINFGSEFKPPTKVERRLHRVERGKRLFTASEIQRLLATASVPVKAMILLGINCGFGNADCGTLPLTALDLKAGWVNFPRPKTAVERRCPLWPQTIVALKLAIAERSTPTEKADADCVFVTVHGHRWVRTLLTTERMADGTEVPKPTEVDALGLEFGKLLKRLGINGRSGVRFYALRHSFRTIADNAKDVPAVRLIMGHADSSIDDVYREHIDDSRLQAVVEHVRQWLFAKEPAK